MAANGGGLAYYCNVSSAQKPVPGFSTDRPTIGVMPNLVQIILRAHGYDKIEIPTSDWTLFWCLGFLESSSISLCALRPSQRVNRFPGISALSIKTTFWETYSAMLGAHGPKHYNFVPQSYVCIF